MVIKLKKNLFNSEIQDELMIQFIIMYTLHCSDESLSYTDLLNIIQGNCEISFTDLQLGLDNLIQTGHVSSHKITDILYIYSITQKGEYVIDFFSKQIPLIIRDTISKSLKELFLEKRRSEAVKAYITPINIEEFNTECELCNDDRTMIMQLKLYSGTREQAEEFAEVFKNNSEEIYGKILNIFNDISSRQSTKELNDK